ncbi:MAG: DNA polymerase III subunit chi, partial [Oceanococcaceae bacterium]
MTRVSFYVHETASDTELWVCRLLDKILRSGHQAYVYCPENSLRESLDRRLWTWSQGSFTAHELQAGKPCDAPIVLGADEPLGDDRGSLLLYGCPEQTPPAFFSSFERCLEIVAGSEEDKIPARA